MFAYLNLMRPLNCLMSVFAVFIGGLIVLEAAAFSTLHIFIAMLATFLIIGAGNAINDYFDIEADKINKPLRPLPSGRIKRTHALVFSLALFALGIILSLLLNPLTFLIATFNSLLLIFYSSSLQNKLLIGNIAVSYLVGSTFLFGGAASGKGLADIMVTAMLLLLAFFANLSREIVKDLEDVEGDKASFLKRLAGTVEKTLSGERFDIDSSGPTLKHKTSLLILAQISLVLAIAVSPLPFVFGILGFSYLLFLIPTNLLFILSLSLIVISMKKAGLQEKAKALLFGKKIYRAVSKYIKFGMFFGLLAFVAGTVF